MANVLQEMVSKFTGGGKKKPVIFQSRFRSYRTVIGKEHLGNDLQGRPILKPLVVEFENYLKVVPDTEENAKLIAALRKGAELDNDFEEIDLDKKQKEDEAKDIEIAALRKKIADLEATKLADTRPKVRRGRPPANPE